MRIRFDLAPDRDADGATPRTIRGQRLPTKRSRPWFFPDVLPSCGGPTAPGAPAVDRASLPTKRHSDAALDTPRRLEAACLARSTDTPNRARLPCCGL